MCGLSGILLKKPAPEIGILNLIDNIRSMGLFQFHRGPDAWGEYVDDRIALGHNRLSILDVDGGSQPMASVDGRYIVIFNGEIYNFKTLWRELEFLGHSFRSDHSDTEVILNGFIEWDVGLFSRLEGMFAIAIWDVYKCRLLLGRDRLGIKPLYYYHTDSAFYLASEPKAIVAVAFSKPPSIRQGALSEYFLFRSPVLGSMIDGVEKLAPGHYMDISDHSKIVRKYWEHTSSNQTYSEVALLESLQSAVISHKMSDVPLGVFLSGGVDSSVIAALLRKSDSFKAFTIGVNGPLDESGFSQVVADHLQVKVEVKRLDSDDLLDKLDTWMYFNDDPVADPSGLALMFLSEAARSEGYKVMLTGEGADELFGGYNSYIRYAAANMICNTGLTRLAKGVTHGKINDYFVDGKNPPYLGTAHIDSQKIISQILNGPTNAEQDHFQSRLGSVWRSLCVAFPKNVVRRAMLVDQLFRLPNDVLSRTDRATMAYSVEARIPFLDRSIVEMANGIADNRCIGIFPKRTKIGIKSIARKLVPIQVVDRPKVGFDLPVAEWIRTSLASFLTDTIKEKLIDGINYEFVELLLSDHLEGNSNHTALLWAWLTLELWYRRWVANSAIPLKPIVKDFNQSDYALLAGSWAKKGTSVLIL